MTMPSLFDTPRARATDPTTAHEAAKITRPGNAELINAIRWYVQRRPAPVSAYEIADAIAGYRWQHDTVRTAVSRAGLHCVDTDGLTPRGRRCTRYVLSERA